MFNQLKTRVSRALAPRLAVASALLASGCATVDPATVSQTARPNQPPTPAVTRFEEPLQCMDRLFADFGVSGVTIAVSAVPDYTGRVYVGSDIWLQSAITKMSQRSGAFVVTDYNPNQLAPEQGLWALSSKTNFYIPAYYVRGAISGFAGNVADASNTAGIGTPIDGAAASTSASYSLVSVDLTVGNLQQRTLISRAQAANEVVLETRAAGAQLGGMLQKYGANLEIVASRSDGIPHAVRALIELNAIEVLGRLTGVPYWSCLGADDDDATAAQARADIHHSMSEPERVVFLQRRLNRLGYYSSGLDGVRTPDLMSAAATFAGDAGYTDGLDELALYEALTQWSEDTPAPARRTAAVPPLPLEPASQPVQAALDRQSQGLNVQIALVGDTKRAGAPVSLSLQSNALAYAYCYLEDSAGTIARVFPNRWQPDPLLPPNQAVTVPGKDAAFDLVLPQPGAAEQVACFVSSAELSQALPGGFKAEDLTPLPVPSLSSLSDEYSRSAETLQGELVVKQLALSPE